MSKLRDLRDLRRTSLRELRDLRRTSLRELRGPTRTQQLGLIIVLAALAVYVILRAY